MIFAAIALTCVAFAYAGKYDQDYNHVTRLSAEMPYSLTLFVKLAEDAAIKCPTVLYERADPDSPNYGKHFAFEDMMQFANEDAFRATRHWLSVAGFSQEQLISAPNLEFIAVQSTVGEIEKVFGVELHRYQHKDDESLFVHAASDEFELPEELAQHVDTINGLKPLPYYRAGQRPLIVQSSEEDRKRQPAQQLATPSLLWSYYGIKDHKAAPQASQQLFAALGQNFAPADLKAFQQKYMLPASVVSKTTGVNFPADCVMYPNKCIEANLDVQTITSTAQLGTTEFWGVPTFYQDIFLHWAQGMAATKKAPLVNSISYGSLGPEDPKNDMKRFNIEVCKLGLRGITVISATGDDGVANFQARGHPLRCGFVPSYPATSPFVTAVGATQGPEAGQPEKMCSSRTGGLITSGGGFSDYFPLPLYQAKVVQQYIRNKTANLPPKGNFNSKGRAYPDVAMLGHNYEVIAGGRPLVVSGTSASAPFFASTITLINSMRFAQNKTSVGFINPALYKVGSSSYYDTLFHDMIGGMNNCCAGQPGQATCCPWGFTAIRGWDPTTGFGSIKFEAFAKYFVGLP